MPVILKLDRERSLKWTMRSEYRLGSLPNPPKVSDLASRVGRKSFASLCAHIWACLEDAEGFASPEDVAEYMQDGDTILAAMRALLAVMDESTQKKKAGATAGSTHGHSA